MKAYNPTSRSAVSFSNSNFNLSLVHFCPPFSLVVKAFLQPSPPGTSFGKVEQPK